MNPIDELNDFSSDNKPYTKRAIPYEKYFGEMALSEPQIRQRIEFAEKFEDRLLEFLTLFSLVIAYNQDDSFLRLQLQQLYFEISSQYIDTDDYVQRHGEAFADNFIESTKKHESDPWYTSKDRAKFNAENEANDILNYSDFQDAIRNGMNAKTWVTMKDNRVRKTHKKVDEKTIPIGDTFEVGGYLMRFPGDEEFGADDDEIVCCRCSLRYSHNPSFPTYTVNEETF